MCLYDLRIKTMFGSSLPSVVCLIYIICVCLRIVVFNTYCVVFLFSSCVHYVASISGFSFLIALRNSLTFIYRLQSSSDLVFFVGISLMYFSAMLDSILM
jgi:hypothetical protein